MFDESDLSDHLSDESGDWLDWPDLTDDLFYIFVFNKKQIFLKKIKIKYLIHFLKKLFIKNNKKTICFFKKNQKTGFF